MQVLVKQGARGGSREGLRHAFRNPIQSSWRPPNNSRFHFGNSPRVLAWWILLTIDRRPSRAALSLRSSVSRSWVTCPLSAPAAISGLPRGRWWQSSRLGLTPAGPGSRPRGKALAMKGFIVSRRRVSVVGCFGIRYISTVAHPSYETKNFAPVRNNPLSLVGKRQPVAAPEPQDNEQIGVRRVGGGMVAADNCVLHGVTVVESGARGQLVGVRVGGSREFERAGWWWASFVGNNGHGVEPQS